jgi:hypothetical protein
MRDTVFQLGSALLMGCGMYTAFKGAGAASKAFFRLALMLFPASALRFVVGRGTAEMIALAGIVVTQLMLLVDMRKERSTQQ